MSGLTVAEVFGLLAEHADCGQPAVCAEMGYESLHCPKHTALNLAAAKGADLAITRDMVPMDCLTGYSLWIDGETPRVVIALLVWRVTAEFIADSEPLRPGPGQTISDAAEEYVRRNWAEAESCVLDLARMSQGRIISTYLGNLCLYDDYQRIKTSRQHLAFENSENNL